MLMQSRFRWPRVLRHWSAALRRLGLRVRIPPVAWMFLCCDFCASPGRCVVQRSPTKCGVPNTCDRQAPYGEAMSRNGVEAHRGRGGGERLLNIMENMKQTKKSDTSLVQPEFYLKAKLFVVRSCYLLEFTYCLKTAILWLFYSITD
jgi:hypothetical protein